MPWMISPLEIVYDKVIYDEWCDEGDDVEVKICWYVQEIDARL